MIKPNRTNPTLLPYFREIDNQDRRNLDQLNAAEKPKPTIFNSRDLLTGIKRLSCMFPTCIGTRQASKPDQVWGCCHVTVGKGKLFPMDKPSWVYTVLHHRTGETQQPEAALPLQGQQVGIYLANYLVPTPTSCSCHTSQPG